VRPLLLVPWIGACAAQPALRLDHEAWQPVDANDDPFADHRPAEVRCITLLTEGEEEAMRFEVRTEGCNWASLQQPLPAKARAGAWLVGEVFHNTLWAEDPTTGHLALAVGDDVVWEAFPAIPGPFQTYPIDVQLPSAYPEGTLVTLHVHNHGPNAYTWLPLSVEAESP